MKLEHAVHPHDIKSMLHRAGFSEEHIREGFESIKRSYREVHQDIVAHNGFLPPLSKVLHLDRYHDSAIGKIQHGLFSGRLRRKDFILGFLFFFGIGYVVLSLGSLLLSLSTPGFYKSMMKFISRDEEGIFIMAIPFVLAPVTVMMLSLITRRLHNLELPGVLSLLFLAFFIPPAGNMFDIGYWALYVALAILFVVLMTKKGNPKANKHGPLPSSKGSFFRRIFNH